MTEGDGTFLKERADRFLENASNLLQRDVLDLAAFNFEQAAQLLLRYHFYRELENFPQTNSLQELITAIGRATENTKNTEQFLAENRDIVRSIESAYMTARFLPGNFERTEVEQMETFLHDLVDFVEKA